MPGATPRDGCDGGTPIAPQTAGFGGVAPGTTGGAIAGRPLLAELRDSVPQARGGAVRRSGGRDVTRHVTGCHRRNHTRARQIEAALAGAAASRQPERRDEWASETCPHEVRRCRHEVADAALVEDVGEAGRCRRACGGGCGRRCAPSSRRRFPGRPRPGAAACRTRRGRKASVRPPAGWLASAAAPASGHGRRRGNAAPQSAVRAACITSSAEFETRRGTCARSACSVLPGEHAAAGAVERTARCSGASRAPMRRRR